MVNSLLPAGVKIRVLTTIEDGQIYQETVGDDQLVCNLRSFVEMSHQQGLFVSNEAHKQAMYNLRCKAEDAELQCNAAREIACMWMEGLKNSPEDNVIATRLAVFIEKLSGALDELSDLAHSAKKE